MAPPSLTYRTAGDWGSGKGSNLTPAEVDSNFWDLISWITTEVAGIPSANGIANITVSADNVIDIYLDDGTHFGPFTIATNSMTWQGEWEASTAYSVNDVVSVTGAGLFLVLVAHTSPTTWDANHGPNYYGKMLGAADAGNLGGGGILYIEDGSLTAPDGSQYEGSFYILGGAGTGAWAGQTAGTIAAYDGATWTFSGPTDGQVVYGYLDGTAAAPRYGAFAEFQWRYLGNYLRQAQGLWALSVGQGEWNADESNYPFYLTGNGAYFDAWATGDGGTGHIELHVARQSISYDAYVSFKNTTTRKARVGLKNASDRLVIESHDGTNWNTSIEVSTNGFVKLRSVTYSQLPAASSTYEGFRCFVTDAAVNTWGATISAGSGSYKVPAWCDGTNWLVG